MSSREQLAADKKRLVAAIGGRPWVVGVGLAKHAVILTIEEGAVEAAREAVEQAGLSCTVEIEERARPSARLSAESPASENLESRFSSETIARLRDAAAKRSEG